MIVLKFQAVHRSLMLQNGQRVHVSFRNFARLPHIVDHDYPLDLVKASMDVGFNGSFSEKQLPTTTGIFWKMQRSQWYSKVKSKTVSQRYKYCCIDQC